MNGQTYNMPVSYLIFLNNSIIHEVDAMAVHYHNWYMKIPLVFRLEIYFC